MQMSAAEVMANLFAHVACPEGVAWAAGKDSDAMWAADDELAAPYLFWWVIQNAGQTSWPTAGDVIFALQQFVIHAATFVGIESPIVLNLIEELKQSYTWFGAWQVYTRIELELHDKEVSEYRTMILPVLKRALRPSL